MGFYTRILFGPETPMNYTLHRRCAIACFACFVMLAQLLGMPIMGNAHGAAGASQGHCPLTGEAQYHLDHETGAAGSSITDPTSAHSTAKNPCCCATACLMFGIAGAPADYIPATRPIVQRPPRPHTGLHAPRLLRPDLSPRASPYSDRTS